MSHKDRARGRDIGSATPILRQRCQRWYLPGPRGARGEETLGRRGWRGTDNRTSTTCGRDSDRICSAGRAASPTTGRRGPGTQTRGMGRHPQRSVSRPSLAPTQTLYRNLRAPPPVHHRLSLPMPRTGESLNISLDPRRPPYTVGSCPLGRIPRPGLPLRPPLSAAVARTAGISPAREAPTCRREDGGRIAGQPRTVGRPERTRSASEDADGPAEISTEAGSGGNTRTQRPSQKNMCATTLGVIYPGGAEELLPPWPA